MTLKVESDTPFLTCLWTDLAKILVDLRSRVKSKVYQIFAKLVHRGLRKGVSEATFEGKKHQPKFKGRTLLMFVMFVTDADG